MNRAVSGCASLAEGLIPQKLDSLLSLRTGAREAHERQAYIVWCLGEECSLSQALPLLFQKEVKKNVTTKKNVFVTSKKNVISKSTFRDFCVIDNWILQLSIVAFSLSSHSSDEESIARVPIEIW